MLPFFTYPIRIRPVWAIAWLVAITWLSTRGSIPLPGFRLLEVDKLAHAAAYALLAALVLLAIPHRNFRRYGLVFGLAFGYGALMEWVQYRFFPHRFFEWDDMVANGIGALMACWVVALVDRRYGRVNNIP